MTKLLILAMVLIGNQNWNISFAYKKAEVRIPTDFVRHQPQEQVELSAPISARSLSGRVIDFAGFPIPDVRVERIGPDREKRLNTTFTNSKGSFAFAKIPKGSHFLKLSKPGFNALLVRVITSRKSKAGLKLVLPISK